MTRKHYKIFADLIYKLVVNNFINDTDEVVVINRFLSDKLVPELIKIFEADNPNFDASKFINEIGLLTR